MRGIGGIILAAGGSTRLGEPKQLLKHQGETLVHAAVRAAQEGGCEAVCVVTGCLRQAIEAAIADLQPLLVHNDGWQRGIGSSIRLGFDVLPPASAVVVLTCDQPAVDADVVASIIQQHRRTGSPIVASRYSGTLGIPALFDESCFAELLRLPDGHGAKALIQNDPARVSALDFAAGAFDLDSPDDVREWHKRCAP